MRVAFVPAAGQEVREAAAYYERQAEGLGTDFLLEIDHAVTRIAGHPHAGQLVDPTTRRRLLRRFPYCLLYRIDPEEIVIVAVMHLKRKPGYWRRRP